MLTTHQSDLTLANRTIQQQAEEIARLRSDNSILNEALNEKKEELQSTEDYIVGLNAIIDRFKETSWWRVTAEKQPDKRGQYLIINNYGELLVCPWNEFKGWAIGNGGNTLMPPPEPPKEIGGYRRDN